MDSPPQARASTEGDLEAFHLRAAGLSKAFGPTQALRDASFVLAPGEVHVLAGENGSGKSTLVKILSGVYLPDAGLLEWSDPARMRTVQAIPRSPRAAQELGLATVFQEVRLAEIALASGERLARIRRAGASTDVRRGEAAARGGDLH